MKGVLNTGDSYSFSFTAYPDDWKKCSELQTAIYTESDTITLSTAPSGNTYPDENESNNESQNENSENGSETQPKTESYDLSRYLGSSGGCEIGLGAFALSILLLKRKSR